LSDETVAAPSGPAGAAPQGWQPGQWVEGWQLEELLGRGGMGVVYRARDAQGRAVALKTLARDASPQVRERMRREGVAQARADGHPNVVRVHAAGELLGQPYLVQELVSGGTLGDRLSQGPLPAPEACELVAALARGVAHLHARGILHRDLKPSNVLFDGARGTPKLCDFGLARLADAESLTKTGQTLGTVSYMAPEQVDAAKHADERTDVYGLGALLFACLAGRPPRASEGTAVNALYELLSRPAPRLRSVKPDAPQALDALCARALASDPAERFSSALELAEALEDPRLLEPPSAPRRAPLLVGALALLAAALAGVLGWRGREGEPGEPSRLPGTTRRTPRPTPQPRWRIAPGQTLRYRVTWEEESYTKVHDRFDSRLLLRFSAGDSPGRLRFAAEWRFLKVEFPNASGEAIASIPPESLARSHGKTALAATLDLASGALVVQRYPVEVFEQIKPQSATPVDADPRAQVSREGLEISWASGAFQSRALPRALELLFARTAYPESIRFRWAPRRRGFMVPELLDPRVRVLTPLHWTLPYDAGRPLEQHYTLKGTRRSEGGVPVQLQLRQEADFEGKFRALDLIEFKLERD